MFNPLSRINLVDLKIELIKLRKLERNLSKYDCIFIYIIELFKLKFFFIYSEILF